MKRLLLSFMLIGMLAMTAVAVQAETAPEITFEPPTYVTGTIHLQNGWSSSGSAGVPPQCGGEPVYDHEVAAQALYPSFGAQSLRISNAVTSGCFGDQTYSPSLANEAGETIAENGGFSGGVREAQFEAQWDFASTVPGAEQPGLLIDIAPTRGDETRMSLIRLRDMPTGLDVVFFDYQLGIGFVSTTVATGLDRTVPHTVKFRIEFVDGSSNDIVTVWVNGFQVHVGTSFEDYYGAVESGPTRTVDSIIFHTRGTAVPATDGNGFYIDNFTIASGPQGISSIPSDFSTIEACLYAGSLSQVTIVEAGEESTLSCGRGEQVTLQQGFDYYACLYAGSLSKFGTTEPTSCGQGEVISLATGDDLHGCMYAGKLSKVSYLEPASCGRGTQVDLATPGDVIVTVF